MTTDRKANELIFDIKEINIPTVLIMLFAEPEETNEDTDSFCLFFNALADASQTTHTHTKKKKKNWIWNIPEFTIFPFQNKFLINKFPKVVFLSQVI